MQTHIQRIHTYTRGWKCRDSPHSYSTTATTSCPPSPTGDICVNTLKKDWKPETTLKHVLQVALRLSTSQPTSHLTLTLRSTLILTLPPLATCTGYPMLVDRAFPRVFSQRRSREALHGELPGGTKPTDFTVGYVFIGFVHVSMRAICMTEQPL
jgi:hypothetical protein